MGQISVRLNPKNNKDVAQGTDPFDVKKLHPVLNCNWTVDVVDGLNRLTPLRQIIESSDAASVTIKSCTIKPLSVEFISQKEQNPLSDWEIIEMSRVANAMSKLAQKETSFVCLLSSVLRYAVIFYSEYNVTFSQAGITNVAEDLVSSHYLTAKSRQSYLRYVRVARL